MTHEPASPPEPSPATIQPEGDGMLEAVEALAEIVFALWREQQLAGKERVA